AAGTGRRLIDKFLLPSPQHTSPTPPPSLPDSFRQSTFPRPGHPYSASAPTAFSILSVSFWRCLKYPSHTSPIRARCAAASSEKPLARLSPFTSSQLTGTATGAPSRERTDQGQMAVEPRSLRR